MTNVKSLKKAAAALFAAVLCLSAVLFSGYQNVIPDMALQAEAAAADEYLTEFLNSGYDASRITIYDGSNEENFMSINGRKYYQGLKFTRGYWSDDDAYISFNVEDINKISFTVGRIDGTNGIDTTLKVYRDGSWWRDITIGSEDTWTDYSLDVSKVSILRLYLDTGTDATYGLAEICVDSYKPSMKYTVPKYTSDVDFINSMYNNSRTTIYDGSNEFNYMQVNGRQYYQGIKFTRGYWNDDDAFAKFNVENVKKIKFTVCRIDNTNGVDTTLKVYRNGLWWQDITISSESIWETYTLDLTNISTLRFYFDTGSDATYALGDIEVDNFKTSMPFTSPTYTDEVDFMTSNYNTSRATIYDGSNEFNNFAMNGRNYIQGVKLTRGYWNDDDAFVKYNVENIKRVTFTFGRVDNTAENATTLNIYKDGILWYQISKESTSLAQAFTIDTTDTSTLTFYLDTGSDATYALANIAINGNYSSFGNAYSNASKITDIDKIIEEEAAKDAAKANLGDVNEDGTVDSSDASKVLAAYAAVATGGSLGLTETQELNADVNMDGAVDSSDASSILGFYAYSATGGEGTMAEYMGV